MTTKSFNNPIPQDDATITAKQARIAELQAQIDFFKGLRAAEHSFSHCPGRTFAECDYDLRKLIDSNIVAIHRADVSGNLKELNDAFVNLLGYSREEWLSGKVRWNLITPPEFRALDELAIEQIKHNGRAVPFEKQYICKDGTRKTVLIGVMAADNSGNDCFCFTIDITARKKMEEKIRESERKFRLLAEAIPHIVWIAEIGGKVRYANNRFYESTGLRREDEDGWLWLQAIHPDDHKACFEDGGAAVERTGQFELEVRYRTASGEYRWHLVRGVKISYPSSNDYLVFGTSTDIDDFKQLQDELRESELRFHTLANAIPQIVWTADSDGRIDFFNDRWFEGTGLSLDESENRGWEMLIHPQDLRAYVRGWKNAVRTGDSYEMEFRLKRADRNGPQPYLWHLCRAVALRDANDTVVKWFGTWTQIDDQKRNQ